MIVRITLVLLVVASVAWPAAAQSPAPASDLQSQINSLGSLDYAVRTRAARQIRRAPEAAAVVALSTNARMGSDEFVRYRAFILLTAFSERATTDVAKAVLRDRNDRLRQVAYEWFERHPDTQLGDTLVSLLQTEQAEFVRPALVGAVAAIGDGNAVIQRSLVAEVGRGLDMFRSAAIESLGDHHALYATDAIANVSRVEGPLQDDAVIALGRLGGASAQSALKTIAMESGDIALTARAALCLTGQGCETALMTLVEAATAARTPQARLRSAVSGLESMAQDGKPGALEALLGLASRGTAVRDEAALALSGVAIRKPDVMLAWLGMQSDDQRKTALGLLKDGFETLEEDFGEEQFYATARATYWKASDNSPTRTLMASVIDTLGF
jgi:hypothetical protein